MAERVLLGKVSGLDAAALVARVGALAPAALLEELRRATRSRWLPRAGALAAVKLEECADLLLRLEQLGDPQAAHVGVLANEEDRERQIGVA